MFSLTAGLYLISHIIGGCLISWVIGRVMFGTWKLSEILEQAYNERAH